MICIYRLGSFYFTLRFIYPRHPVIYSLLVYNFTSGNVTDHIAHV